MDASEKRNRYIAGVLYLLVFGGGVLLWFAVSAASSRHMNICVLLVGGACVTSFALGRGVALNPWLPTVIGALPDAVALFWMAASIAISREHTFNGSVISGSGLVNTVTVSAFAVLALLITSFMPFYIANIIPSNLGDSLCGSLQGLAKTGIASSVACVSSIIFRIIAPYLLVVAGFDYTWVLASVFIAYHIFNDSIWLCALVKELSRKKGFPSCQTA